MSETLLIALVAAGSAAVGSVLTTIFAPWVNWGIEKRRQSAVDEKAETERLRALVASWRAMVAEVAAEVDECEYETEDEITYRLEQHPDFQSLEPLLHLLTLDVLAKCTDFLVESELPEVLVIIKKDIARLEHEWRLV